MINIPIEPGVQAQIFEDSLSLLAGTKTDE
jgi:hypothetical protein